MEKNSKKLPYPKGKTFRHVFLPSKNWAFFLWVSNKWTIYEISKTQECQSQTMHIILESLNLQGCVGYPWPSVFFTCRPSVSSNFVLIFSRNRYPFSFSSPVPSDVSSAFWPRNPLPSFLCPRSSSPRDIRIRADGWQVRCNSFAIRALIKDKRKISGGEDGWVSRYSHSWSPSGIFNVTSYN